MIKGVCFDLDNCLADLSNVHYLALNEALLTLGFEGITLYDHTSRLNGLPTRKKLEALNFPEDDINIISHLKQRNTILKIKTLLKPEENIIESLEYLSLLGIKIGLASNAVRETVDLALEKMQIQKYFNFTISNQDVKSSKPSPEIYLKSLELMELSPDQVLVADDHPYGWKSAQAAGLHLWKVKSPADITKENLARQLSQF